MQAMKATQEQILESLKASTVEVREEPCAVRRPGNAHLPGLEERPQHRLNKKPHAHDGGVVILFKGIPEEQSWIQIKEKLKEKLPEKVPIWYASHVSDKKECVVTCGPFENDLQFFEELQLEIGGVKLPSEVCHGEVLQACLKMMPKNIREKREKEARKRQKERNRPLVVGSQKFINMGALRGRVKEILNSRSDGESLKADGADFKLMMAVLKYHPKGDEKSKGCVGMKVGKSPQAETRCFFMIREDGTCEDFSAKKCLEAIEQNPPYADEVAAASTASAPNEELKAAAADSPMKSAEPVEAKDR